MIKFINSLFLQNIWFFLWCLIWGVYLIADSFPIGIGLLSVIKIDDDKAIMNMLDTIGPFWGGNQVWLILAAGGTFAAFPLIFSKMFTWLYLPMMLLLFGLILRGLAIELLHHETEQNLKQIYKWSWFFGSLIITVVLGLFFSNLFSGFLIGSNYSYYGTFFTLITKFSLLGVIVLSSLFILSGLFWLSYKTSENLSKEYFLLAKKMSIFASLVVLLYLVSLFNIKNISINYNLYPFLYIIPIFTFIFSLISLIISNKLNSTYDNKLYCFMFNSITILFLIFTGFITLYPYILKSSIDILYGVSIYISSSSDLTLSLMLVASLIFVPIVLVYQLLSYTIFKKKIE